MGRTAIAAVGGDQRVRHGGRVGFGDVGRVLRQQIVPDELPRR